MLKTVIFIQEMTIKHASKRGAISKQLQENVIRSLFLSRSDDKSLTSDEFLLDWQERCLGSSLEGVILFHHLDVDRNGHIEDTDIPWVMNYFDGNCKSLSFYHFIIVLIRIRVTYSSSHSMFCIKLVTWSKTHMGVN